MPRRQPKEIDPTAQAREQLALAVRQFDRLPRGPWGWYHRALNDHIVSLLDEHGAMKVDGFIYVVDRADRSFIRSRAGKRVGVGVVAH